jgi:hypothetical protein
MNIKICRECHYDYTGREEWDICPSCHSPHKLSWWPMGQSNVYRLSTNEIWDSIITKKAKYVREIDGSFSIVPKDRE